VETLKKMVRKVSKNGADPCFVLKCDIQKFFDSVDHEILLSILRKRIKDEDTMWLLASIVESYGFSPRERERERERERNGAARG
jgi:retron-type reverse transcriptase